MIEIEVVGNQECQWGEGALWWGGALLFVDIEGKRIHRFDPDTGKEESWETRQRVGTVVPREGGGFVFAGDDGMFFMDEKTGDITPIADPEPEKADNRFNDGKCSPDGRFFAGTISLVKKEGDAKLYRLDPDLILREAYGPVTNSNGIVWSADGKSCYYIDTPRKEVLAFDYSEGNLTNPRPVVSTKHHESSPDGMAIDADGNLWVAFCHGACVCCFSPESGEELRKIDLPCRETTSCAFGGADLGDLYVTTGKSNSEAEEHGGRLFRIRGIGVQGVAANAFAG